jgi:formylglycine-generating enzyme required for sulfatase activity
MRIKFIMILSILIGVIILSACKVSVETFTLTIDATNGTVSKNPDKTEYEQGETVTLTAVPDTGWSFIVWGGDLTGSDNPTSITIDGDKTITANFIEVTYRDMVSVPSGTFTQSGFTHSISSFEIGKYEVTYELWYAVRTWAEGQGYSFANLGREGWDGTIGAEPTASKYEPVTYISWRDTIVWCNAYSEMAGKTAVYENESGIVIKNSNNVTECDSAVIRTTANGYRLPTEGQWQYAASYIDGNNLLPSNHVSGDTSAPYYTSTVVGNYAWYRVNAYNVGSSHPDYGTHEVGTRFINHHLGIYDMSGNVYELCWDWGGDYPTSAETDYHGPITGSYRVIRGGSWNYDANYLQVGYRSWSSSYNGFNLVGFRVARSL